MFINKLGETCYWLVSLTSGNWKDAERACLKNNGHLWTINTHTEWLFVIHTIGDMFWPFSLSNQVKYNDLYSSAIVFIGMTTVGRTVSTWK